MCGELFRGYYSGLFRQNRPCYGFFVDFANAYNCVPHTLLFEKLKKKNIFCEEELAYLRGVYSRLRIKIGKKLIKYNRGVVQGSVIRPALFNIFIEDLADELKSKEGISLEDLLFYADDILIICSSPSQLKRCIEIVNNWASENGMKVNKQKSGVVVFTRRIKRKVPDLGSDVLGYPVVSSYKYLGTVLDSKLSLNSVLSHILKKSDFTFFKLYPYLANATADGRRDLWQTLIAPLFNAALVLFEAEPTKGAKQKVMVLWRGTFKKFLMLSPHAPTVIVNRMMAKFFDDLVINNSVMSEAKWMARKEHRDTSVGLKVKKIKEDNPIKGIPNTFCKVVNLMIAPCPKCKGQVLNSWHLKYAHGIEIELHLLEISQTD